MGQKINPRGFRLGITENWHSRWFMSKQAHQFISEDIAIRKFVTTKLKPAGIARVEIERAATRAKINIFSAKPGLVIGKKGKDIEDLRKEIRNLVKRDVSINIIEVRKPDLAARLLAENIAFQLERRVSCKRAMKDALSRARRSGAEGVKIQVGGRINGSEIARVEKMREGRVPLHTLRAEVDYNTAEAHTTYGILGIKVWIFKGMKYAPGDEPVLEAIEL